MAKGGMTRRIDELGRLVIPKEIRKNLRIKDNDQVEINVMDNKIVLSKYDELNKDYVINMLLSCLKKTINKNILFTSREKVIEYFLINKNNISNFFFNEKIMNIIESRKDVFNYLDKELVYSICPLIINGDIYGSIIVYGVDEINNNYLDIIKFSKKFLENYLE